MIANFAVLVWIGSDVRLFGAVMFADNFGVGFAGVALVTYMSTLTSVGYTATQYALLSSATPNRQVRERLFRSDGRASRRRPDAARRVRLFFVGGGLLGVPALVLCVFSPARRIESPASPARSVGAGSA